MENNKHIKVYTGHASHRTSVNDILLFFMRVEVTIKEQEGGIRLQISNHDIMIASDNHDISLCILESNQITDYELIISHKTGPPEV